MLSTVTFKNTRKKFRLSKPSRFAYLQTQQIYKLQRSCHLNSTSIDLCSRRQYTHSRYFMGSTSKSDMEETGAEGNGISRGEAPPTCVGTWGLSLVSWVERCPPSPELSRENECGWALKPRTWHLQTPWSLSGSSKRATYMTETTTGRVFRNSRSQWIALYHRPSVNSACYCCVCSQAKGPLWLLLSSDCFLAPITNGLLYQLPGNSLSTHTQTQKSFSLHILLRST